MKLTDLQDEGGALRPYLKPSFYASLNSGVSRSTGLAFLLLKLLAPKIFKRFTLRSYTAA